VSLYPQEKAYWWRIKSFQADEASKNLSYSLITWEYRLANHDFGQNTAETPYVYTFIILVGPEQDFRCPIPTGSNVFGQYRRIIVVLGDGSYESEVADLNKTLGVEEYVAGLQVPMDDFATVQILEC
jgi:hypothetical protein